MAECEVGPNLDDMEPQAEDGKTCSKDNTKKWTRSPRAYRWVIRKD